MKLLSLFLSCVLFLMVNVVSAQYSLNSEKIDSIKRAGGCESILPELKAKYESEPNNTIFYTQYLTCLLASNKKKESEKLIRQFSDDTHSMMSNYDQMAYIFVFEKDKKVLENPQFLGNPTVVMDASVRWEYLGLEDLSISILQRSEDMIGADDLYDERQIELLEKKGNFRELLPLYLHQMSLIKEVKVDYESKIISQLSNPNNQQIAADYFYKETLAHPSEPSYAKMLMWVYVIQDNWESAVKQATSLDLKTGSGGKYLMELAQDANTAGRYDISKQIFDKLDERFPDSKLSNSVFLARINMYLQNAPQNFDQTNKTIYKARLDTIFLKNDNWNSPSLFDYTDFYFHILGQKDEAIDMLEKHLESNFFQKSQEAKVNLQLGDYFAQEGNRWDAMLYYARVEKAYKDGIMGEDARFRNARLSYFFGDFEWAKSQLEILKTVTSELIANDALELWLRIVDNTPSDSNFVPLQGLAKAEWFYWQKEYDSADHILTQIVLEPRDKLYDDIYLLQSKIAHAHLNSMDEKKYLQMIIDEYGDDILADDAYYLLAQNEIRGGHPQEAKKLLENFLLKFDNSPLLIEVRKLLDSLQSPVNKIPVNSL